MYDKYLLTGATGFLGNTIAWLLHRKKMKCVALVLENDPYIDKLPPNTELAYGDVLSPLSLEKFFSDDETNSCLIHCAGIVSIASKSNPLIYDVNVNGTRNIFEKAYEKHVKKIIYVSSIHAIPVAKSNKVMTEINSFDPKKVKGHYAKSKAIASNIALQYSSLGMDVSIVHPSGIIGPGDWRCGQITSAILLYLKGKLPAGVKGKNNFVDVRDVANGILSCAEHGKSGECYLITGHEDSVKNILEEVRVLTDGKKLIYLPLWIVKIIAPFYEMIMLRKKQKSFLTPYSAFALGVNSKYSYRKANKEFNYYPRPLEKTISDTVKWLKALKFG